MSKLNLTVNDPRLDEYTEIVNLINECYNRLSAFNEDNECFLKDALDYFQVDSSKCGNIYEVSNGLFNALDCAKFTRRLIWNYLAVRDNDDLSEILRY